MRSLGTGGIDDCKPSQSIAGSQSFMRASGALTACPSLQCLKQLFFLGGGDFICRSV